MLENHHSRDLKDTKQEIRLLEYLRSSFIPVLTLVFIFGSWACSSREEPLGPGESSVLAAGADTEQEPPVLSGEVDTSFPASSVAELSGSWGSPCILLSEDSGAPDGTYFSQVLTFNPDGTMTDEMKTWSDALCTVESDFPGYFDTFSYQVVGGVDNVRTTLVYSRTSDQQSFENLIRVVGNSLYYSIVNNGSYNLALSDLEDQIVANLGLTRL